MIKNFRTLDSAVLFYQLTRALQLRGALKTQLDRAASSIALNLAEGRGRHTTKDQLRFFNIAMGSVRECQAILTLSGDQETESWQVLDKVASQLFRLIEKRASARHPLMRLSDYSFRMTDNGTLLTANGCQHREL